MSEIEVKRGDSDEWPYPIRERLFYLMELAYQKDFSILCAVGLHHERKRLSVIFSPTTSQNPHMIEMLDDMIEMFQLMRKRLQQ
jgi:hypothetical protein